MSDEFITGDEFDPEVAQAAEERRYERKASEAEAVEQHIRTCQGAYNRVFKGGASPDDIAFVLSDLAWFCRAYDGQFIGDARLADTFQGRRSVFMRIAEYTKLDHDTLMRKYARDMAG